MTGPKIKSLSERRFDRKAAVRTNAALLGLELDTHRPGRHRVYTLTRPNGHTLTGWGVREAEMLLRAYMAGKEDARG